MTTANGGAGGQAPTSDPQQGQAPQANNSGSPSSAAPAGQASAGNTTPPTTADLERMVADLRRENAQHRTKLKAFEDAQAAADAANLSDLEKVRQQAQTAETTITTMRQRIGATELKVSAQAAGIIDPDVAAALLGPRVEYDAAGEPTNVAELVTDLKKAKPHLFGGTAQPAGQRQSAAPSAGATNPGRQAGNAGLTLEIIQQLSPRELRARAPEIAAWYKSQQQLPTG